MIKAADKIEDFRKQVANIKFRMNNLDRRIRILSVQEGTEELIETLQIKKKELESELREEELEFQKVKQQVRMEKRVPLIVESAAKEFLSGKPGSEGWYFGDKANGAGEAKFYGPFVGKDIAAAFEQIHANEYADKEINHFEEEDIGKLSKVDGYTFFFPDQAEWPFGGNVKEFKDIVAYIKQYILAPRKIEAPKEIREEVKVPEIKPIKKKVLPLKPERGAERAEKEELVSIDVERKTEEIKKFEELLKQKSQAYEQVRERLDECVSKTKQEDIFEALEDEEETVFDACKELREERDKLREEYEIYSRKVFPKIEALRMDIQNAEFESGMSEFLEEEKQKEEYVKQQLSEVKDIDEAKKLLEKEFIPKSTPKGILSQAQLSRKELERLEKLTGIVEEQIRGKDKERENIIQSLMLSKDEKEKAYENIFLLNQYRNEVEEQQKQLDQLISDYRIWLKNGFAEFIGKKEPKLYGAAYEKLPMEILEQGDKSAIDRMVSGMLIGARTNDFKTYRKEDKVNKFLRTTMADYASVKIRIVESLKNVRNFAKDIESAIKERVSPEEWNDIKDKSITQKVKDTTFVTSPSDFIKSFDPAFAGGSPHKKFYFSSSFISNPKNVETIKNYFRQFYIGQKVYPWLVENKINLGEASDETRGKLNRDRRNIIEDICKRAKVDPEKFAPFVAEELDRLIDRIFLFKKQHLIDPEDRYYYYDDENAKRDEDKNRRTPIIFRNIHTSFNGYVTTSLYNAVLDNRSKTLRRAINCPFSDCDGQIYVELEKPEEDYRKALSKWRGSSFSECNECGRPISNRYVNCPNCLSAVPLSSTWDAWHGKYNLGEWKRPDDSGMEEMRTNYKVMIEGLFDAHNEQRSKKKFPQFFKAFIKYMNLLSKTVELNPDNEILKKKLEEGEKIKNIIESKLTPELSKEDIQNLRGLFDKTGLESSFEKVLMMFLDRGKMDIYTGREIAQLGKISNDINKRKKYINSIFGGNEFLEGKIKIAAIRGRLPSSGYRPIDYSAIKFDGDIDLVCPNCQFGMNKGEFNPRRLSSNISMEFVAPHKDMSRGIKLFDRKNAERAEEKGIIVGNTEDVDIDISGKFGKIPIEQQPKFKVLIKRYRNAGFQIKNLANASVEISRGSYKKDKLYRNQVGNFSTGGYVKFADGVTYKFHSGIFLVSPIMFAPEYTEEVGAFGSQENIGDDVILAMYGAGTEMFDGLPDKERERAEDNYEFIGKVLKAYCRIKNNDDDIDVNKYMASLGEKNNSKELEEIIDILNKWKRSVGLKNKDSHSFVKLDANAFEILKNKLLEALVPDGVGDYEGFRAQLKVYMDGLINIYDREEEVEIEKRKYRKDIPGEVLEEERQIKEEKLGLEERIKYDVSKAEGKTIKPLGNVIAEVQKMHGENDVEKRLSFYNEFVPQERIVQRDFLDRHLLNNYQMLIALKALTDRFSKVPQEVRERSTLAFSEPEKKQKVPNYLPQIREQLNNIFILKDDKDEDTELSDAIREREGFTSFSEMICDAASEDFLEQMKNNKKLFSAQSVENWSSWAFGKQVGETKSSPALPLYPFSNIAVEVEKNSYAVGKYAQYDFKVRMVKGSVIVGITNMQKDGEAIGGTSDFLRGTIYLNADTGLNVGDVIVVSGHLLADEFFNRTTQSVLGTVMKNVFGEEFKYRINVMGKPKSTMHLHPIIYKLGLDKQLLGWYKVINNPKRIEEEKKIARRKIDLIRKQYKTIISRLRNIDAMKKGEKRGDYLATVQNIPPAKEAEFWNACAKYMETGRFAVLEEALKDTFGMIGGASDIARRKI